jgi:glycosyltransferase involved in cell wall biosynthesis
MTTGDASLPQTALFLMSASANGSSRPFAPLIVVGQWASAAERAWGGALVVTPQAMIPPGDALRLASRPRVEPRPRPIWRQLVPGICVTAWYDVQNVANGRTFRDRVRRESLPSNVILVWQYHRMFQTAGHEAAKRLGVPLVQFVDAPQVWEAARWGVRRPGWGTLIEAIGESPHFRRADVICCISEEVANAVTRLGGSRDRTIVTPNGVDLEVFSPTVSGDEVRRRLGLDDKFVVGWVGSFRSFHALPIVIEAIRRLQIQIDDIALLLVGDGQERLRIERLIRDLGVRNAVITGTVPFGAMGSFIAAIDVAVAPHDGAGPYHYSPLKMREYMASGKPVVAASAGEMRRVLREGSDALLFEPGDVAGLVSQIARLYSDQELRTALGVAARAKAVREWSWDEQLGRVARIIGISPRSEQVLR